MPRLRQQSIKKNTRRTTNKKRRTINKKRRTTNKKRRLTPYPIIQKSRRGGGFQWWDNKKAEWTLQRQNNQSQYALEKAFQHNSENRATQEEKDMIGRYLGTLNQSGIDIINNTEKLFGKIEY